ncbi:hypothetical protein [Alicyclobacillus sendaiensis]|uniref:Uncharacterized protein n=1 Tax=Alicyclobacillus sendaiensis PA2 TaxID=3029425 RepID=A0ABT6XUU6_ALISE|nr:hypothetical protein [Alicyclobacillus sendaiensis]MDI9258813.1 hypothetical protein [Alicyclobacillus sendaiensis PA2]
MARLAVAPPLAEEGSPDAAFATPCALARGDSVLAGLVPVDALLVVACGAGDALMALPVGAEDCPPVAGPVLPLDAPGEVALPAVELPICPAPVSPDPVDEFRPVPLDIPLVPPASPAGAPFEPAAFPYALSPPAPVAFAGGAPPPEEEGVEVEGGVPEWGALFALVPVDVLTVVVCGGMVSGFCTVATCSFGDQTGSLVGTTSWVPDEPVVPSPDPVDACVAPFVAFDLGAWWAAARAYACQCGFSPKIMNHA